ncbi:MULTISPECIES: Holliday junction resolvase RuvX [Micrococcus]|uniref:Putative pre-16S rRNA nuclease n=1 Tax=Micrococcus terreus TaxID=574650 RepID=A0A1I7MKC3_9MICC|nr:Holliday junction resolvase RuvX [Micrococcus terreus]MCT2088841.1 Holliday junction resolvase RuvX [Micrococcus terreus]MDK7700254.1 Holliday junction resolvase RuvX [Micrococcus terreus]WOO98424.1 Holliday junction resolvase RuvX [Micrococcus terreus]SFV22371.1 putative holliday junction resolvase [Micrococcus terreus]
MTAAGVLRGVRLGVDVGKARVGLAAADPDGILATPVTTLKRDAKKGFDQRIICKEALQRDAVVVYVGHPVNLQGRPTASTEDAVHYAEQLAERLVREGSAAQVRLVDERLSTVTAHQQLREAGRSTRDHRSVVDQAAAVQILQQALDMQQSQHKDVGRLVGVPAEGQKDSPSD